MLIADPQVRYCGTLGGNVANGDPGNDMPAVMQCLGASYWCATPDGERGSRPRDFYEAAYFTGPGRGRAADRGQIPSRRPAAARL